MRVLALVTDAFGARGGIALYNRDLLSALSTMPDCDEVTVLARSRGDDLEVLPSKIRVLSAAGRGKIAFLGTAAVVSARSRGYGLIVCSHINLVPIAWLIGLISRAPVVLVIYGIDSWTPTRSWLVNFFARRVARVISISEVTKSRFVSWSNLDELKVAVLPNAIHLERYGVKEKDRELLSQFNLSGKTVLMTMGRVDARERYKGFDQMIEMIGEFKNTNPSWVYLVVGEGSDVPRLMRKASDLGVASRVIFTGFVSEPEKARYISLADAFVMPSTGEGFGFVFLEAMACGIPTVASQLDGGREAVRDGAIGILVDPTSSADIRRGVLTALRSPREIPQGLEFFEYENFRRKAHEIFLPILGVRR